jgi:hypothetical protein
MDTGKKVTSHQKMIEFIPFKTLSMDLETILSNVTKIYLNRYDYNMAELIALSEAELYPIGSYDENAEKYEYVLKLSVPAKYFDLLKNNIDPLRHQILRDIEIITAPYLHEFISEVFIVMKIEHDSLWRNAILENIDTPDTHHTAKSAPFDFAFFFAPSDARSGIVVDMEKVLIAKGFKITLKPLLSINIRDLHSVLKEVEKTCRFGICCISKAFIELPFTQDVIDLLVSHVIDPRKSFFQVWDNVSRTDIAGFNPTLARSLACSTERMSAEMVCENLLLQTGLK